MPSQQSKYQECDHYPLCGKLTERVVTLETEMKDLQQEKVVTRERVREMEKVIWKAVGAVGLFLGLIEILLKLVTK